MNENKCSGILISNAMRSAPLLAVTVLSACGLFQTPAPPDAPQFAVITTDDSYDCKNPDAPASSTITGEPCKVVGKVLHNVPTENLSYILYPPQYKTDHSPVICTLPAAAVDVIAKGHNVSLSVPVSAAGAQAALAASAATTETAQLLSLDTSTASALYILTANFSLCMAYGSGAIDTTAYKADLKEVIEKAATIGAASAPKSASAPDAASDAGGDKGTKKTKKKKAA